MLTAIPTTLLASDQVVYVHDHSWWPVFPIFWALFWIVLVFGFLRRRRHCHGFHQGSTERVLSERYARGEIDEGEFQQRLAVLRGTTPKR